MNNPQISVIVPVYNAEKWLRRCVDSILAQTFTDFELLLIDDGSTDGSPAICDEYAQRDSRIKVFYQKNRHKAQRKAKFYINKCRSASCMQSGWKRTPA